MGNQILSLLRTATSNLSPVIQDGSNIVYGSSGITHIVSTGALFTQQLQTAAGTAINIFGGLPVVGMVCSGIDITDALLHSYLLSEKCTLGVRAQVHAKTIITVISNGILFDLACKNASNVMNIGSAALSTVLSGFVIKAAADVLKDGWAYLAIRQKRIEKQDNSASYEDIDHQDNISLDTLQRKESEAQAKLLVSALNLIGWGTLALAHTSFVMTLSPFVTPALMIIGSLFLIAAGGYGLYTSFFTHDRFFQWPIEKECVDNSTHSRGLFSR